MATERIFEAQIAAPEPPMFMKPTACLPCEPYHGLCSQSDINASIKASSCKPSLGPHYPRRSRLARQLAAAG
jgi:hypothetical protein